MTKVYVFLALAIILFVVFCLLIRKAYRQFVFDYTKKYLKLAVIVLILAFEMLHGINIIIDLSMGVTPAITWVCGAACLVRWLVFNRRQFKYAQAIIDGLFQCGLHKDIAQEMQMGYYQFGSHVGWFEHGEELNRYLKTFSLFTSCDLHSLNTNAPCVSELRAIQKKFRTVEFTSYLLFGFFISFFLAAITFVVAALYLALK